MNNKLIQVLKQAQTVLLLCHVAPDGDTLGSALALRLALKQAGCETTLACADPCPRMYRDLPGAETIVETPEGEWEAIVAVDCADVQRLGKLANLFSQHPNAWQIDHHITNSGYSPGYMRDCAATGELVLDLLETMEIKLDRDMALCLFIAMSTDTGHFRFANTTPQCMRAAARCMELGVDVEAVTQKFYRTRSLAKTLLIGRMLNKMELLQDGQVCLAILKKKKDYEDCGAVAEETEGLIDEMTQIEGVRIVALLRMQTSGLYKASLRAREDCDVTCVAKEFSGGGHVKAAGCVVSPERLPELKKALCEAARMA